MAKYNITLNSSNQPNLIFKNSWCKKAHDSGWSNYDSYNCPSQPLNTIKTFFADQSKNIFSTLDSISSSMTLNEAMNRLRYQMPGLQSMSIVSLNTSHPVPIHTSDSQKYYLIIGGKRRLIPDIQTLRYLEHKYNFNENRDIITVPYSQIVKYPDGGSFTSVVVSTREAQQQLSNLFSATNSQYTSVVTASSTANNIVSMGSITLDNYNNNISMAQNYYNSAVSSYNKGEQELKSKSPFIAAQNFNAAKVSNISASNYANKAKQALAALNILKPKYIVAKNTLLSLKQKYQLILTTIAKQMNLATNNEFIKANTSGLMQIQATGNMATSKATSSINQINSSLQQLASVDITKVSLTTITGMVAKILSQQSAINAGLTSAGQQTSTAKTQQTTINNAATALDLINSRLTQLSNMNINSISTSKITNILNEILSQNKSISSVSETATQAAASAQAKQLAIAAQEAAKANNLLKAKQLAIQAAAAAKAALLLKTKEAALSTAKKDLSALFVTTTALLSQTKALIAKATALQSNYAKLLAKAISYYNTSQGYYAKANKALANKETSGIQAYIQSAKSYNTQAQSYANEAKTLLSQLSGMASSYTTAENSLISLKQKYQTVLTTISDNQSLSGYSSSAIGNQVSLAIGQINNNLQKLAKQTKVSISNINSVIAKISSQQSSINATISKGKNSQIQSTIGKGTSMTGGTTPITTTTGTIPTVYGATSTNKGLSNIFGSLDNEAEKILPTSMKQYAKYTPLLLGGLALLLVMRG